MAFANALKIKNGLTTLRLGGHLPVAASSNHSMIVKAFESDT
jgi:hypothetical protein